jgi:glutamyl/glutaminyl-tRNA synthetase
MISRLAPTPSGFLHWGNLYNFALVHARVRRAGGTLWLRIDDVDASRMRPSFVDDIFETLEWLGIDWDRGPRSTAEFVASYSQSLRREEYAQRLKAIPTYTCACSRLQIQARAVVPAPGRGEGSGGPGGLRAAAEVGAGARLHYDGHCRELGLPHQPGVTALRMRLPSWGDPVLWTREDRPAYHLVSVVDDLRMGTTHLIRGEDLRESSEIQRRIAESLGEPAYDRIVNEFHPLLIGPDGRKLSKSADAESLRAWRERGASAEEVWAELAQRVGSDLRG